MKASKPILGTVAGFLATLPMTLFMHRMHRRLPHSDRYPLPPAEITAELMDRAGLQDQIDEPQEKLLATLLAHFGYGAACGGIYGSTLTQVKAPTWVKGSAYGLAVWVVSYFGILPGFKILSPAHRHPMPRNLLMIAAHLVWGTTTAKLTDLGLASESLLKKKEFVPPTVIPAA